MNLKRPNRETLTFLAPAVVMAIVATIVLKAGTPPEGIEWMARRTRGWVHLLYLYASWLLVLAAVSYGAAHRGLELLGPLRHSARTLRPDLESGLWPTLRGCFDSRTANAGLVLALFMGIGVRAYFLSQPIRYDESLAFFDFADGSLRDAFSAPLTENHVLHTLLVKLSINSFGVSPAMIRLPALAFGILAIVPLFCLSRLLGGAGFVAALAAAVHPYLILYSTNARGYSLIAFFSLLLILAGFQARKKPSMAEAWTIAAIAALGLFATPVMFFPVAGVLVWLGLAWWRDREGMKELPGRVLAPSVLLTVSFALLLYTPVILVSGGVRKLLPDPFLGAGTYARVFIDSISYVVWTASLFIRDIHPLLCLIALGLLLYGFFLAYRKERWTAFDLAPSLVLGAVILILFRRALPVDQAWLYLLPVLLALFDVGYATAIEHRFPHLRHRFLLATAFLAFVVAGSLVSKDALVKYRDTGLFDDAHSVARLLERTVGDQDRVFVPVPADWCVYFYLYYDLYRSFEREPDGPTEKEIRHYAASYYSIKWYKGGSFIRFGLPRQEAEDGTQERNYMLFIPENRFSRAPMEDDPGFLQLEATDEFTLYRSLDPERLLPEPEEEL